MQTHSLALALSFVLGIVCMPAALLAQPAASLIGLGFFHGRYSHAHDVSADGSVVVGIAEEELGGPASVFHWTATGSTTHPAFFLSRVAVSADGSVVVGDSGGFTDHQAFRWTVGESFDLLGGLPGRPALSSGIDASANGQVVVGWAARQSLMEPSEAFRWTSETGMVGLGNLPIAPPGMSIAWGVSADGSIVVGDSVDAESRRQAFRWTQPTGMVGLGFLPGADFGIARRTSADGSVVVGVNRFPAAPGEERLEAFRWTESEGMVSLGDLPGGKVFSDALDVSGDGSVIVGTSEIVDANGTPRRRPFFWTLETGMVDLYEFLVAARVPNIEQWDLSEARGVSYDGRTVVGVGISNRGTEGWVATIPEPSTIWMAILALVATAIRRPARLWVR